MLSKSQSIIFNSLRILYKYLNLKLLIAFALPKCSSLEVSNL